MIQEFQMVKVGTLVESKTNPRRRFDETALTELTESIRTKGILVPLLVRPNGQGFEIVAGARRFRAAKAAKVEDVPVRVRPMSDTEVLEIQVLENLQREDLHPLEEAEGYRALTMQAHYDVATIAAKVGKSTSYVYQRMKLAELIEPAKKACLGGEITAGHAILIARLQPAEQTVALKFCREESRFDRGGMEGKRDTVTVSVRELGQWIQEEIHLDLHAAMFPKEDATLVPAAGPCTTCPKRTGTIPDLFPEIKKRDTCTDPTCFSSKVQAFAVRKAKELGVEAGELIRVTPEHWTQGRMEKTAPGTGSIFTRDRWKEAKTGSCQFIKPAVVVHGPTKGTVVTACTHEKCHRHFGKTATATSGRTDYGAQQRRAQEKARRESGRRRAILAAIHQKVTAPLPRALLEVVALGFWQDVWHENQKAVAAAMGWLDETKRTNWADRREVIEKKVSGAADRDLARLLVALGVARDLHAPRYQRGRQPDALLTTAKLYKINIAAIDRAIKTEEAARKAKKPVPKKRAVQTAAKKKAKAAA